MRELDIWLDNHEECFENIQEDDEGYFIYLDPRKEDIKVYLPEQFNNLVL